MKSLPLAALILLFWGTPFACTKQNSRAAHAPSVPCDPTGETINGYRDDDNCPDELARLLLKVTDRDGQPLEGVAVRLPGMGQALKSDPSGLVVVFELLPVPSITIELKHPSVPVPITIALELLEGENEVLAPTPWAPVNGPKSPSPQ